MPRRRGAAFSGGFPRRVGRALRFTATCSSSETLSTSVAPELLGCSLGAPRSHHVRHYFRPIHQDPVAAFFASCRFSCTGILSAAYGPTAPCRREDRRSLPRSVEIEVPVAHVVPGCSRLDVFQALMTTFLGDSGEFSFVQFVGSDEFRRRVGLR